MLKVYTPRKLAEEQLVRMYEFVLHLREHYKAGKSEDTEFDQKARLLIDEQYRLRPLLRQLGEENEDLLYLGSRLCQEINEFTIQKSYVEKPERVKIEELAKHLHGTALYRLKKLKMLRPAAIQ